MARRKKSVGSNIEKDLGRSTVNYRTREPSRRKRSQQPARFSNYVYKVLKQVHPQLSMTNKAMRVMDDFMQDIYLRLVSEASGLVKLTKRSTLSASEFQTATRLILPGELAKHAISEASKAVANFLTSRNEDAKRSRARRVINNPPSTMPVTANNEEPVEIEIFGTVPRPLLSGAREVAENGDMEEESMEEDEFVKDADFTRKMQSIVPPMDTNPRTEITNTNQNKISTDSTTKRVLPIDNTTECDVPVDLSIEESVTDEENGSRIQEKQSPPTPPTEVESDNSIVVSETSKRTEAVDGNRRNPHNGEKKKMVEEAETVPMDEEAETQPMDEEAETQSMDEEAETQSMDEEAETQSMNEEAETVPMGSQSISGRVVEPNTLLIVDVVGNIQESSSMISNGSTISTQLTSSSNTCVQIDTENGRSSEPSEIPGLLSVRKESVMTDSGCSTLRDVPEPSSLTVRCSTITSTKTTLIHERKEKISECWFTDKTYS